MWERISLGDSVTKLTDAAFDLRLDGPPWMDYIAGHGYDVYLVDARGYGAYSERDLLEGSLVIPHHHLMGQTPHIRRVDPHSCRHPGYQYYPAAICRSTGLLFLSFEFPI